MNLTDRCYSQLSKLLWLFLERSYKYKLPNTGKKNTNLQFAYIRLTQVCFRIIIRYWFRQIYIAIILQTLHILPEVNDFWINCWYSVFLQQKVLTTCINVCHENYELLIICVKPDDAYTCHNFEAIFSISDIL